VEANSNGNRVHGDKAPHKGDLLLSADLRAVPLFRRVQLPDRCLQVGGNFQSSLSVPAGIP